MTKCLHRKKYFKPSQEGYEIICIDCKKVLTNNKNKSFLEENKVLISALINVAIGSIILQELLKCLDDNKNEKDKNSKRLYTRRK